MKKYAFAKKIYIFLERPFKYRWKHELLLPISPDTLVSTTGVSEFNLTTNIRRWGAHFWHDGDDDDEDYYCAGYASLHLFGNFYKLLLAVLMNWMRLCFEKKNSSFFSFHVKSVSPPPRSGSGGGDRAAARRRGGGGGRDTSVLRPLYLKYIGLKKWILFKLS